MAFCGILPLGNAFPPMVLKCFPNITLRFSWIFETVLYYGVSTPANIYLFKVNNRNTRKKGVKHVQKLKMKS